ncbi:hypothetical protein BCR42DRAFT_453770 [Absidia repens]|uniref:G-patch domain-containing protein n=1 Tax=Absidia repens TaxID=90262 RepID=A0A1X2I8V0_9FUNG|nr:hypothetical protein BCR42DRAFT_453770 [Absidia repens]
MFSQSKQSQPTFKFIIRSDLSTDAPSEDDSATRSTSTGMNHSAAPVTSTEHNIPSTTTTDQPTSSAHDMTSSTSNIDKKRKRTEKDSGVLATKKVHSYLERWGQSQEELAASQGMPCEEIQDEVSKPQQQQLASQSTGPDDALQVDFGDYQLMACLLCNRKFKSKQDITRHQALSDLHKKNSQDPVAIDKARAKLRQQATKQATPTMPATSATPAIADDVTSSSETPITYRNRAAERRQAYNQPECPDLELPYNKRPPLVRPNQETNAKKSFESGATLTKPVADDNVGARMLQQMGWKRGQGLGKEGSGIVDPVTAERYAQGAGLGSANAKSRLDSGGGHSYKDRAKELARRRLQEEL